MTATAIIVGTTSASTAYTESIIDGSSVNIAAHDLTGTEAITIEVPDAAGNYTTLFSSTHNLKKFPAYLKKMVV